MKRTVLITMGIALLLVPMALLASGDTEPAAEPMDMEGVNSNPLSDVRVRQAIAYAIDMETLAETLFEGRVVVADSLIPPGPFHPNGLNSYDYNPTKAKELLREAGWDADHELQFVFYYGDQLTVDLMNAFQSYLSDVGVKMQFKKLEGDLRSLLWTPPADPLNGPSAVDWDICYAASGPLLMQDMIGGFYTSGFRSNSHTPTTPGLDDLIAAQTAVPGLAAQTEAMFAVQEYWSTELPSIPLFHLPGFVFESKDVNRHGGAYGNEQWHYDWGILDWTVTPNADGKQVLQVTGAPVEFFQEAWFVPGKMYHRFMLDTLIVADAAMNPIRGELASDYDLSADGMTATFTLRNDITWHDGTPITADEIKWNIEFALQVGAIQQMMAKTFKSLQGAEEFIAGTADEVSGIVVEGNTITLSFATLDPFALYTFSQFTPLPQKYFEDSDPLLFQQNEYWQRPVGSGPYRIDRVEMNDFTTLVPYEDYYGGSAKIDEVVMYPASENEGDIAKNAEVGKLDYGYTKSLTMIADIEAMDHMRVTPINIPLTRFLVVNKFPRE